MSRMVRPGQVWLVDLGRTVGSEPRGRRPAVVVGSAVHCALPIDMALVAPCTTKNRGLPHHVAVDWHTAGLNHPTWVRTEDVRSISERRLIRSDPLGSLTDPDLAEVRRFIEMMTNDD